MKEIELRSLDLNIEKTQEDVLEVQGYVASDSFSHVLGKKEGNKWREVITPGVFNEALSKARRLGNDIDFLVDHNDKKILASTSNDSLFLEEDETGLYINAKISRTSWGKDLFVLVKDGIIKGLSFGMRVLRDNWTQTSDGIPLRTILEIDLFEISALKLAAYPTTLLEARGLEVVDIEIPKDIEKRGLGGNQMDEEEDIISPVHFYKGLTLIAEKLDIINDQIIKINSEKANKNLEEANRILSETKAVVDAVSNLKSAELAKNQEDNGKKVQKEEKRSLETAGESSVFEKDEKDEQDVETDKEGENDNKSEIIKDKNIDQEGHIKNADKNDDIKNDEDSKQKEVKENKENDVEEYRSLLNKLKMEVPEIE